MLRRISLTFLVIMILFSGNLWAQPWSGIIDPSRAIDWSSAGVVGGVPNRTVICSTLGVSGQSSTYSQSVTKSQIQSAIASCASAHSADDPISGGGVVYLNAGTYTLTSGIDLASKVTLRGAGADKTILKIQNSGSTCNRRICLAGSNQWSEAGEVAAGGANAASWIAGYTRGATNITLANVGSTGIINGKYIYLDQRDTTSKTGNFFVCESTSVNCSTEGGNGGRVFDGYRGQVQIVKVVSGCASKCSGAGPFTITITPGLYGDNWNSGQSPGAWWATTQLQYAGLEDITIDDSINTEGAGNISIYNGFNCWIKGIRSINADRAHIQMAESAHNTVMNSYFYGTKGAYSQSYGVESYVSSDNLVVNNIAQRVASPWMTQAATGNVYVYNFEILDYYCAGGDSSRCNDNLNGGNQMGLSTILHNSGVMYNLWEGNVAPGMQGDAVHGSGGLQTLFRNRLLGYAPFVGTRNTQAITLYANNRAYNVVGNVLGTEGFTTVYSGSSPSIYELGIGDGAVPSDPGVASTLMRWGNYDTVNKIVRWVSSEVPSGIGAYANSVPATQTLPASFYYASKPSWWPSGKAWPPIGPDVSSGNVPGYGGRVNTIPAQDCYTSVMRGPADGTGPVLSFNASTCYQSSGGGSTISPPSNLRISQ